MWATAIVGRLLWGGVAAELRIVTLLVMNRFASKIGLTLRWTLAAWALLATTFEFSTLAHGHFRGGLPHRHDRSDAISISADLSHLSSPGVDQDGYHGGMSLSDAGFHQHLRFPLLGAVGYLPVSSEPGSSHQKSPCGWETIIAVSAAQSIRTCSNGLAVDHLQLASVANLPLNCLCPSGEHEIAVLYAAPSATLCDRARHERSGVQLA